MRRSSISVVMSVPLRATNKQSFENCMPMLGTVLMRAEWATGIIARYRSKVSLKALKRRFEDEVISADRCLRSERLSAELPNDKRR